MFAPSKVARACEVHMSTGQKPDCDQTCGPFEYCSNYVACTYAKGTIWFFTLFNPIGCVCSCLTTHRAILNGAHKIVISTHDDMTHECACVCVWAVFHRTRTRFLNKLRYTTQTHASSDHLMNGSRVSYRTRRYWARVVFAHV